MVSREDVQKWRGIVEAFQTEYETLEKGVNEVAARSRANRGESDHRQDPEIKKSLERIEDYRNRLLESYQEVREQSQNARIQTQNIEEQFARARQEQEEQRQPQLNGIDFLFSGLNNAINGQRGDEKVHELHGQLQEAATLASELQQYTEKFQTLLSGNFQQLQGRLLG